MEGKQNISEYRERLDKTVRADDLSSEESVKILVEKQMSKSSQNDNQEYNDNLVQKRTKEVANFLSMLRSASGSADEGLKTKETPNGGWKIKHDNQDCRVMYREGPVGTPFHTLLVEGYVDGPVDNCLCISWESGLYQKWWPQFNIPAFKIVSSECLQKVRTGEQISLVRMKLSWPLSMREALVHYVSFEYFQDDLIIVLLNTISDRENIDKSTHGFTKDGIPDEENVTRIDVVGGLAIQKVTANRSYFRTIVNMDIKLDFVPPSVINFVSRQLIGSGFKLYKKEVASVSKGDPDFSKALKDPFYSQVREALYSDNNVPNGLSDQKDVNFLNGVSDQETVNVLNGISDQKDVNFLNGLSDQETVKILNGISDQKDVKILNRVSDQETVKIIQLEGQEVKDQKRVSEIEEIQETGKPHDDHDDNIYSNELYEHRVIAGKRQITISPEVNQALGTLEKVISIFRELGFNPRSLSLSRFTNNVFANLENDKTNDSKRFEAPTTNELNGSKESRISFCGHSSRHVSYAIEKQDEENGSSSRGTHRNSFSFAVNEVIRADKNTNGEIKNVVDESIFAQKKAKKHRICCLSFTSGRLTA